MAKQKVFLIVIILSFSGEVFSALSLNGFDLRGASIPSNEIHHGGPPRDGIPAIHRPKFEQAQHAHWLDHDDRVMGVVRNGIAKAYPIAILNWHEIVNDRFGREGIVVSYCPLCGTGIVFTVSGLKAKTFGVSGLLYNSDMLLYDLETESLWSQVMMEAVTGDLKGERFQAVVASHTSWKDWRARHPETLVLSRDTGFSRNYSRDPYSGYELSRDLYFPVKHQDRRHHPKASILGLVVNGKAKAYPFSELDQAGGRVVDQLGGKKVTVVFDEEAVSARVYSEEGKELPALTAFWFAWIAFHPETAVFSHD